MAIDLETNITLEMSVPKLLTCITCHALSRSVPTVSSRCGFDLAFQKLLREIVHLSEPSCKQLV